MLPPRRPPRPPASRSRLEPAIHSRLLATAFSLLCFAAALVAGVAAGNPAGTVFGRGLTVLLIAYAVGRLLGAASAAALDAAEPAEPADADDGPRTLPFESADAATDAAPAPARRAA